MAKNILGPKKHKLCEQVTGKKYHVCYTRGGSVHFLAECWYSERDADYVNYKYKVWFPTIRDGQRVTGKIEDVKSKRTNQT